MDFNSLYNPDNVHNQDEYFSNIYDNIDNIIKNEFKRFRNSYDRIKFSEDYYALIEKTKEGKKEKKTYINRITQRHDTLKYEFNYKLRTSDDVNRMLCDIAIDIRKRISFTKIRTNQYKIKYTKSKFICSSMRDYITNEIYIIYKIKISMIAYKIFKHYRFCKSSRHGKSRSTTHSKPEEDFEAIKPKMCLFELMFNNIDIYLDELPPCIEEYKPNNKRQRID